MNEVAILSNLYRYITRESYAYGSLTHIHNGVSLLGYVLRVYLLCRLGIGM